MPGGGACPVGCLPTLPLLCFLAPIPQPLPRRGRGEILGYFYAGASPLASPRLGGARHWGKGRTTRPAGACPLRSRVRGIPVPGGGRARLVACLPCLCFTFLPLSPTPFPGGEGETKVILCKGLRPLHPRAWAGRGTGEGGEPRARRGACPYGAGEGASRCPAGGVPGWSPAYPAFALLSCPYPSTPLPRWGRGTKDIFMQGASPLASPGLNLYGAGSTFGKQFLSVMPKTFPFNNIIEESP